MRKVSLRNLAAHKVRLALTVLSVVLGTAFVAGSFVFTDTLRHTFDSIFAQDAQGVDVRVSTEGANSRGVPLDDIAAVESVPGVRAVVPAVSGQVVLLDEEGVAVQTGGAPSIGVNYVPPEQALGPVDTFVDGAAPAASGEVAVNRSAAERADLAVGDATRILVPARGIIDVTVSGIYDIDTDTGGFIGVSFVDPQARELFTDGRHVEYVDVGGDGIAPEELRDRVAAAFPDLQVQTGDEVREETKAEVSQALDFVNYFMLAFGAIALLVGTFIIYNTFSMIVAQRLRELALLRAVGASRGQVGRSVVLEAVVVGVVGSAIGIVAGIGLAYGLRGLLNTFDVGLPEGALQLRPRTILIALFIGMVVTVVSAYAPARRASRVPPVAAMREEFASAGDSLRIRTIAGAVLAVLGVGALVVGASGTGEPAAITVGLGAFALVLSVMFAAPALSRPFVGALGRVLGKPFGAVGRLARTNAVRNPRRTAATAFALTLGLMLVSVIGVFGASAKSSVDALVDTGVTADYILSGPQGIGVPGGVAPAVGALSDVRSVVALNGVVAKVGGDEETEFGASLDGPFDGVLEIEILEGTDRLDDGTVIVADTEAEERGWSLGDTVSFESGDGDSVPAVVGGIFAHTQLLGSWIVSDDVFAELMPSALVTPFAVFVDAEPGADLDTLRTELEDATEQFVVVQVQDAEQFKGTQAQQIDTLLAILYGLLALAVVIAVLGIVNTLALSVVERRREIGMLRAIGMQRAQIRRTIYLESVLIAVFGAVVGVLLGISFGWGFVRTLRDQGLDTFVVPWTQVVVMLVASGVVGVLAALWPAARAARTPPLAAIADV
ncbi:FtsX-like permease family protein [Rhodococcus triatomae]|uniref:Putative ABC transport system permease protein n=1 Tax=Rhodococcus triatomae TaxID=300028 RepID=A0A1G7Z4G5_9NOCA|nr:FtsX-like permease family protein [Rhodococcus triatomae]QNG21211.1 FtsX-like permease family protein [Rhodococcus triatomae]QNG25499.1 FtsX-like permease family protein [Rhodococcus triatomae]SDH03608.1 putative ABC transport system permease protein [Rhodococcus triatomae]